MKLFNRNTQSGVPSDSENTSDYLDNPLLYLSERDPFPIRSAVKGVQVFGGIGSGKTSGSGSALARAFLRGAGDGLGFGGIVCCAKPDERRLWEEHAAATGRSGDVVIIRPGERGEPPPWRFNFLAYELTRAGAGGGQTENVVNLLRSVVEIVEGRQGEDSGDKYWKLATNELLRNAIDLLSLSDTPLTLDAVCELVASSPTSEAQVREKPTNEKKTVWQNGNGLCATSFRAVEAKNRAGTLTPGQQQAYKVTARYWLQTFAGLNDKTRTSVISSFSGVADVMLRGLTWEMLGTDTNIVPEVTYRRGAIIILDLSIQEYREVGRIIQGIWKRLFQEAMLRRDVTVHPRPVFLWCDESQNFISPFDYEYQAVARAARACTIYLTQNINNYYTKLGANAKAEADALLALFGTKVFHANADTTTNQYAADLIGKHWTTKKTTTSSYGRDSSGGSTSRAETLEYKVEPAVFTRLREGGPANNYLVEGVFFQNGATYSRTGDTYTLAVFNQRQPI